MNTFADVIFIKKQDLQKLHNAKFFIDHNSNKVLKCNGSEIYLIQNYN